MANLEFESLPLFEVIARLTLSKPLPLSVNFLVDLWRVVEADFPEIDELDNLEPPPGIETALLTLNQVRPAGLRFISADRKSTGYVQGNLVGIRWQAPDATLLPETVVEYPRYQRALKPRLMALCKGIETVLGSEDFSPCVANMIYTNFIESTEPLRGQRLAELLKGSISAPMANAAEFYETLFSWQAPSGVDLRFHAASGRSQSGDAVVAGYVLKTSAGMKFENPKEAFARLDNVHDDLCSMFESLLTAEACRTWGKKS